MCLRLSGGILAEKQDRHPDRELNIREAAAASCSASPVPSPCQLWCWAALQGLPWPRSCQVVRQGSRAELPWLPGLSIRVTKGLSPLCQGVGEGGQPGSSRPGP